MRATALALLVLAVPSVATAGIDLSWNQCVTAAPADNVQWSCTPGEVSNLFANFQIPSGLTGFVALDGVVDVEVGSATVPPFWHFQEGGCNATGLQILDDRPDPVCPSASNLSPWGTGGGAADAFIGAYAPGFGGANRARMIVTVARAASSPITIIPGQNYYGFHLAFASDAAASCAGCDVPAVVTWTSGAFYSVEPGVPAVELTSAGLRSKSATVNGGLTGFALYSSAPDHAQADGPVEVSAYGRGILPGAVLRLERTGLTPIVATGVTVAADGRTITGTVDLVGAFDGFWNLVVANPGGPTQTLVDAIDVDAGLSVFAVTPNLITDFGSFPVVITGRGFDPGAQAMLLRAGVGQINGAVTSVAADGRSMQVTFTTNQTPSGLWDVVVTNVGGESKTLVGGMQIASGPQVFSISPNATGDIGVKTFALSGNQFTSTTEVRLERTGETSIDASSFSIIGSGSMMATFDMTGAAAGLWDVVVVGAANLSGRLNQGLLVVKVPEVDSIAPTQAGNGEPVGITVFGRNFVSGQLSIQLRQPNDIITASNIVVAPDGSSAQATVDLTGRLVGPRDVIVANHAVAADTLPGGFTVFSAPRVTSILPARGINVGSQAFSLTGSELQTATTVSLERIGQPTISATSFTPDAGGTSMQATFDLTGAAEGFWDVVVRASSGYAGRLAAGLQLIAPPVLDSIAPAIAGNGSSVAVTIYGQRFVAGQTTLQLIRVPGEVLAATNVVVAPDGLSATATLPLQGQPVGPRDVRVTTYGIASDELLAGFTVVLGPQVFSLQPNSAGNSGPVEVRANGAGFQVGATASLERAGVPDIVGTNPVVSSTDSVLTATFDLTDAPPGAWNYVVRNPNGIEATVMNGFTILATPEIDSIVPRSGHTLQTALQASIYGRRFSTSAQVSLRRSGGSIGGSVLGVTPDGTRINVTFNLSGQVATVYDLRVANVPGGADTLFAAFTVLAQPTISTVVPSFGLDSATALTLTLNGTRFMPGATVALTRVSLPNLPATNVQVNAFGTGLSATLDLRSGIDGFWNVRLDNPDGSFVVRTNSFRIDQIPKPVSIVPADGADTELRDVVVDGTRFVPGTQLQLERAGSSSVAATNELVNGAGTTLSGRFDLRGIGLGPWNVVVLHPRGVATATLTDAFSVFAGPKIVAILPEVSEPIPLLNATVQGSGFQAGAQVSLEGGFTPIAGSGEVTTADGTQIAVSFVLTGQPYGIRDVIVRNPDGRVATRVAGFLIQEGPIIASVNPDAAPDTGVAFVNISGTGFSVGAAARLRRTGETDIVADPVTVGAGGTALLAAFDLAAKPLGLWDVVVQNPSGVTATLPGAFEITYSGPTFASGLDLTWDACNLPSSGGSLTATFDCADPGFTKSLYANFQSPIPLPDFVALDAVVDIETGAGALPDFWHFDPGGCNSSGLILDDAMPAACPGTSNQTPWGSGGGASDAVVTAYAADYGGGGRARLLVSIVRAIDDPYPLLGGDNYFGFGLTWTGDLTLCAGCTVPAEITWTSAQLHAVGREPVVVTGSGRRSNFVSLNGGLTGLGLTSVVPNVGRLDEFARVRVFGRDLAGVTGVALTLPGRPDIAGAALDIAPDGRSLMTTFDLSQAVSGAWSIRATRGGETAVLSQVFRVLSPVPEVRVIVPNGGEVLLTGRSTVVEWEAVDDQSIVTVDLYYSLNFAAGPWSLIEDGLPNTGSFLWRVSGDESNGASALFRVVAFDNDGNSGEDLSDAPFTITDSPTATLLSRFEAVRVSDGVEVTWRYETPEQVIRTGVERGTTAAGPWTVVQGAQRTRDGSTVIVDRDPTPEGWYRLRVDTREGTSLVFGPVRAASGSPVVAEVSGVRSIAPNPVTTRTRIELSVARAGSVRLSVLDLQGREVAVLVDGALEAGIHDITWDGRAGGRALAPGLYFVRFQDASRRQVARLALAP